MEHYNTENNNIFFKSLIKEFKIKENSYYYNRLKTLLNNKTMSLNDILLYLIYRL